MTDFLFRGGLADVDEAVYELCQLEGERQVRRLILIPSESQAPLAVREALSSAFQNVYAEGYPDEDTRRMDETQILDYARRLAHYRRYGDPRYYKGVEYADSVEELARRRCAEAFAANGVGADDIFVNVQPLSGAPANNAVYHALVNPGDTIMGMNLLHGGHLSHGSSANRSGKYYHAVHYTVDPRTEQIDYDQVMALAQQHKPKFIIAGYSSYPWAVDWARFKEIAQSVGAYLFADIAHVAGLVVAGAYPSPVGYADVITFTTHKSLCGPRGACILTTNSTLASKIDRAVFPGEQGGPHINVFAAMAVAFKLARTEQFRQLQHQIVKNCIAFTSRLEELGFRIPYGGTNTHLMNLDCGSVRGADGAKLSGDQAARLLDLAGIVVNRNTIPGDKSAADPSGVRMGTSWITQRGFREKESEALAEIIANLLKATTPFNQEGRKGAQRRSRVDFEALQAARSQVRRLTEICGRDIEICRHGYPHFYYLEDALEGTQPIYCLEGEQVRSFLDFALASDVEALLPGQSQATALHTPRGQVEGSLTCLEPRRFLLSVPPEQARLVVTYLRDLSDGFVRFDTDMRRKLPGPVVVRAALPEEAAFVASATRVPEPIQGASKPYVIGQPALTGEPLPVFTWQDVDQPLRRTPLYDLHQQLGAKLIPFAGWEMPVWYSSVLEEHLAVRQAAGLFDVAHMGVYQAEGPDAAVFLDSVVGNDIAGLAVGESCYTHFLDPQANVIDDLLVYRRGAEKYLIVVNASNDDKDWAWLTAVKDGVVRVDESQPWVHVYGREVKLNNLRSPEAGAEMRVDIALQGPKSRDILMALGVDSATRKRILGLKRTQLCEAVAGGFDLVVSRTGYTGEKMGFELFVHPQRSADLFQALLQVGTPMGLKPIGLGARDSLRTEAGLPLYGHEMGLGSGLGGQNDLGVAEGGFGSYVKTYKPWFIGRQAFMEREEQRNGEVARFRFQDKNVRMAHRGDPLIDRRGKVIGYVTSCAIDQGGYLTGQAFLNMIDAEEGMPLWIYQSASQSPGIAPAHLTLGDKTQIPCPVVVVGRFQK